MTFVLALGCVLMAAVDDVSPTATPPVAPRAVNRTRALKKMPWRPVVEPRMNLVMVARTSELPLATALVTCVLLSSAKSLVGVAVGALVLRVAVVLAAPIPITDTVVPVLGTKSCVFSVISIMSMDTLRSDHRAADAL